MGYIGEMESEMIERVAKAIRNGGFGDEEYWREKARLAIEAISASENEIIAELADALKETLEIASRNEAGPYIRRALDALARLK